MLTNKTSKKNCFDYFTLRPGVRHIDATFVFASSKDKSIDLSEEAGDSPVHVRVAGQSEVSKSSAGGGVFRYLQHPGTAKKGI